MSNLSGVTNYFSTANEGFSCTLRSAILAGSTTVPLSNVTGLTDGSVFVGIIEPTGNNQQTFTGTVDITNTQIKNVVWTRGTNVAHATGVTIVDYVTGTDWNMLTTGILNHTNQAGNINAAAIYDTNSHKILEFDHTITGAVNNIKVFNAPTGQPAGLTAAGTDTTIGINFVPKGNDQAGGNGGLFYNGTQFRALPKDWCRSHVATTWNSIVSGTFSLAGGTGWTYPSYGATAAKSTGSVTGDEIRYKLYLDAGTYTLTNWYGSTQTTGQIQMYLLQENGITTNIGSPVDTYVASGTTELSQSVSGISIANGGYYQFGFKVTGKNASATAYILWYFGTQIVRTA